MNREEYINLAINLNKFMYGDFKKLYRFKTREEFEKRFYEHNIDVYSIAYKNELFANLTKGDFLLLKDAGVISDMTESKDGIFQDASDYKETFISSVLYKKIEQDIINYFNGDLEDDDEILDERAVLTIAAIVLNNPLHNEKHLTEILESFSIVGEYEISFVHLGIVMGFISMYKDEVEECENLTEEDADYIIDIDGIKFYIFNT